MPKPSTILLPHYQQEHSASCLAACVRMLLAFCKMEVPESDLRRILRVKPFSGAHPINLDPKLSHGPIEIPLAEFEEAWQYSRQLIAVVERA